MILIDVLNHKVSSEDQKHLLMAVSQNESEESLNDVVESLKLFAKQHSLTFYNNYSLYLDKENIECYSGFSFDTRDKYLMKKLRRFFKDKNVFYNFSNIDNENSNMFKSLLSIEMTVSLYTFTIHQTLIRTVLVALASFLILFSMLLGVAYAIKVLTYLNH